MRIGRQVATAMIGASIAFGSVATGMATMVPKAAAQEVVAEAIGAGDTASVIAAQLNIRQTPSLSGAITQTLPFGAQVSVVTGPVVADGYTWYRVQVNGAFIGWAVTAFLAEVTPGTPTTPTTPTTPGGTFSYGQTVTVTTALLNVRALPTTVATVLTVYSQGRTAKITSDARTADGITWYAVDDLGWVASQYLSGGGTTTPTTPTTPTGSFAVGSTVTVNAVTVNIRTGAGLSFPVAYTATAGQTFTILEGPVVANGYNWYRVSDLVGAWIAGAFLTQSGSTPTPVGGFAYGQIVTVTASALNVRSLPTTSGSVVTVYAAGRTATITSEARTADGITWYAVDNLGWVSAAYLSA